MNNNNANNAGANGGANTPITSADIPLMLKARYFGSGLVAGVLLSPAVRGALAALQPKMADLMDSLTGQAEGLVERGSDFMARAKDSLSSREVDEHAGHSHS